MRVGSEMRQVEYTQKRQYERDCKLSIVSRITRALKQIKLLKLTYGSYNFSFVV
jgi:hypothetical protein